MPSPVRYQRIRSGGALTDRSASFDGLANLSAANGGTFTPANNVDWSVCFWFMPTELTNDTYYQLLGTRTGTVGTEGWFAQIHGFPGDKGVNFGYSDGAAYRTLINDIDATFVINTWYMFAGIIDNDVTPVLSSEIWDTADLVQAVTTGGTNFINTSATSTLQIGSALAGSGLTPFKGRIDKVGIWNRELVAGEPEALHNSGEGLRYSQLTSGLLANLVAWYDLDEKTGAVRWRDSLGTSHAFAQGLILSRPRAGIV